MKNFLSDKAYKKLDKDSTNTRTKHQDLIEKNILNKTKSILKLTNPLPLYYQKYTNQTSPSDCQRHTHPDILIPLPRTNTTTPHWKI